MDNLIKIGKTRTILISISILLISIHTIYFYHAARPEVDTKKLVQQGIRFLLTIGLLIAVYNGKNWAKITSIILFSLAILGALLGIVSIESPISDKIPLMVMLLIYSIAIYHFGFSKSFKAFFEYQNSGEKEL